MLASLLLGLFLGWITAIPIAGPLSAFVLNYSLQHKHSVARWITLGAATAEGIYVFLAFLGVERLTTKIPFIFHLSKMIAGLILLFLGIYFIQSKKLRAPLPLNTLPPTEFDDSDIQPSTLKNPILRPLIGGFFVSASNPTLIATWSTLIISLHGFHFYNMDLSKEHGGAIFALGVFLGITLWFFMFIEIIKKFRTRIQGKLLHQILSFTGLLLLFLALLIFAQAFK